MEEEKKKTIEERVEEKQFNNLLTFIVGKTFARHAKMGEEEYLKEIGFEGSGKSEDEAVRIGIYNVLVASMTELIKAKKSFKNANELLKIYLTDKKGEEK